MYDLDKVQGDVMVRTGRRGEHYPGIRKGTVHLEGRLGLFDQAGPFGSPTSDSSRTCTSQETRTLLTVIMATSSCSSNDMERHLSLFSGNFQKFCGARESFRAVLGGTTP
jgi:DNA/RNA-binding domain of Phe-tRNA-synthetase-like protein